MVVIVSEWRDPIQYTSKGIGRQGAVLKHWNSLQKEPVPCRPMPLLVQPRMM